MYAGTFSVSYTSNHNLFYWFIRNTKDASKPLVLWVNGGPGASSMPGLFYEHGPLRVNKTGPTDNDYLLYLNPEGSWIEQANVIYLD